MRQTIFNTKLLYLGILFCSSCAPVQMTTTQPAPPLMPEKAHIRELVWKPTMTRSDFDLAALSQYTALGVALQSVEDVREDPRIIGKAYEDRSIRDKTVPVATRVNVEKWCRNSFDKALQMLEIKSDADKGRLRLAIEIAEFSIFDDFTQTGTATLRVTANNPDDMLIWEGQIRATTDLYVHETQSDGISECLSNTVLVVINTMFNEQSFRDAVTKSF